MKAVLLLCALLVAQAQDFDATLREGLLALQGGDLARARDRLTQATNLNQKSGVAWVALAQVHSKLQQPQEADAAAQHAETVAGDQPVVIRALLIYWSGRGQPEPLVRLAPRALKLEDRPDVRNMLGKAYFSVRRFEEGIAELRLAVRSQPDKEQYVFDLGQALLSRENFDEASEVFQAGAKAIPNSAQLQLALGVARYGQRRFDEAITAFLRTIELDATVEQPYVFLGKILDHAGARLPNVEARLQAFLKSSPENPAVNLAYAKALLRREQIDVAQVEQHLRRSLANEANSWEAHFELGVLLARNRKYPEAAKELEAAVKLKPSEASPHYHLARVYDRLGKTDQAAAERTVHEKLISTAGTDRNR